MAQMSDIPRVLRSVGPWTFAKRVWREVNEDSLFAWAAAMAYAWLFAIFPFLVFLVSLLPYLPEHTKSAAQAELTNYIRESVPQQYQESTIGSVTDLLNRPRKGLLSLGLIITLWGASGGMNVSISALEKCYEIERGRPFYKKRPIAIGLTAIVAVVLITLVVLMPIGTIAINWIESNGITYIAKPLLWTWRIARYPISLLLMFTVVNIIYHFGPSIRQRYQFVTPGGAFCVIVWIVLGFAFRLYVEKFAVNNETFRALGGVAILLLFFYLDAAVLLIGAEINSEVDFAVLGVPRGSRDFTKSLVPLEPAKPTDLSLTVLGRE